MKIQFFFGMVVQIGFEIILQVFIFFLRVVFFPFCYFKRQKVHSFVVPQYNWVCHTLSNCDCSLKTYDSASQYGANCIPLSNTRDKPPENQFIPDSAHCKVEMLCYKADNNSWQLPHFLQFSAWHIQGRVKVHLLKWKECEGALFSITV